ncbi:MarR family winged helix-turn-helix transcriptional regulator [Salinispira pacifica]|uniref:HTH marR-type domain-containing protein n=1 Tax=Salinispira pacifica TaxID=1307761 RepID=V5WGM5_9SPIO|nr:winged helix DNA-binding protein [Salinispira pacifica]AHC14938.1 hypothetical protein L21SP2_1545 [Salinispira pacifica]
MNQPESSSLAHLLLETMPAIMGQIGSTLRREAPVSQQLQFHILRKLREGPKALADLARVNSVRLPTMSRSIEAMVNHGWVERFHEAGDRRTVHVRITPRGNTVLQETEAIGIDKAEDLLSGLSSSERKGLISALSKIQARLDEAKQVEAEQAGKDGSTPCGGEVAEVTIEAVTDRSKISLKKKSEEEKE